MGNIQQKFIEDLKKQNINLTEQMIKQFDLYFQLIEKYNQVMDLTAIKTKEEIYQRHFYNSLTIAFNEDFNDIHLCDVGSGAGFPAIPLKIVFPNMKLTIIDSLTKRMDFLKIVVATLDLKDVNILCLRAEEASIKYREKFDIVTARAVARLNILVELVSQMVKVNGLFIAMKGSQGKIELEEATNALNICKMKLIKETIYEPSINYYFMKTNSILKKYPRNYGKIKKKPL